MEQGLGVLCGSQALWVFRHVLSAEPGVNFLELLPPYHLAIWHGILQQCIHYPLHSGMLVPLITPMSMLTQAAILLGRYPRSVHLANWRRLPHPRPPHHLQLLLPHRRLPNAWYPLPSYSPLHRHLPRNRRIRLQLGGIERIHGQQYCGSMEASNSGGRCCGVQWTWRCSRELYCEATRGATVSDCCVGVCGLAYSHDWDGGYVYGVLFSV